MKKNISKDAWVSLFREIGLSDETMMTWHRLFEKRHPDGHQSFLEWLGLPPAEIHNIRSNVR